MNLLNFFKDLLCDPSTAFLHNFCFGLFGLDLIGGLISSPPNVPKWNTVSPTKSQTEAINADISSLPSLQNLGASVNQFNLEQTQKMLQQIIPGYNQIVGDVSGNIQSFLKGEVPKDVQDQIQNNAAARSVAGGYGGSGMQSALTARDLGLTSLNLMMAGNTAAESWVKTMDSIAAPGMFNVSSMFLNPQQVFQDTLENQTSQWQRDWLKSQLSSAYSPNNIIGQSLINTDAQLASIASSIAGSAAGKMI